MGKILVTYATHTGTTRDVAEKITEELVKNSKQAEVLAVEEVKGFSDYDAVVLGAPMIMGWHRGAVKFLKDHQSELSGKPLAIFVTAMSLTKSDLPGQSGLAVHLDEKLVLNPRNPKYLSIKEAYTSVKNYLRPILKAAPKTLKSVAFFGGRLDVYRMKWYEALFVLVIIGAKPGEKRNWPDICAWADTLPDLLK